MKLWVWIAGISLALGMLLSVVARSPASLKPVIAVWFPEIAWVDAQTLSGWMNREPSERPVILDVRTKEEFEVSHLESAVRAEPGRPDIAALNLRADSTVVVYCSLGVRSAAIVDELEAAGVAKVYNLEGGIFDWANEGRPIFRDGKPAHQVHPYGEPWRLYLKSELRAPLSAD
ncbi:MAG: rhodanese-like domain-containing protein [Myxococcales bacterium]|nr:rhodanese-like domain-containing protein [Myxococcales bacterium]MDH3483760.1 rhodanese-like domain-containing protein [Myxococcales bacterium]